MADIDNGVLTWRDKDGRKGEVRGFGPNDTETLRKALQIVYGLFPQYSTDENYAVGSFRIYQNDLYKAVQANGPTTAVKTPGTDENYWVKVLTSTDISDKANTDLSNLVDAGHIAVAHDAMPNSANRVQLTIPSASGQSFIAPASGYYGISFRPNASVNFSCEIYGSRGLNVTLAGNTAHTHYQMAFIPVSKDDSVFIRYAGCALSEFFFWYCNGALSEA